MFVTIVMSFVKQAPGVGLLRGYSYQLPFQSIDAPLFSFGQKAGVLTNPADKNNPKLMNMTLAFFANREVT